MRRSSDAVLRLVMRVPGGRRRGGGGKMATQPPDVLGGSRRDGRQTGLFHIGTSVVYFVSPHFVSRQTRGTSVTE